MLHIGVWCWGDKYPPVYIERLKNALGLNMAAPFTFHIWQPQAEDLPLTDDLGCFARLRTFEPAWQARQGIAPGDRIVVMDLDMVVTGPLDDLFDRREPFVILQGVNAANPCRFNGSVWMLTAGYRPDVWSDFSLVAAKKVPHYIFPEDQAWFEAKMPDAGAWGPQDGVYGLQKPGWPSGEDLPSGAKLVAFFGKRDPSQFMHLDWVKQHWL